MQADQQTIQRLETLSTEQRNPASMGLSSWTTLELLRCINEQDQMVAHQVARVLPDIAKAVEIISERMERGGRLVYVGTGTSGRLGYMDAAECPPTYGCGEDAVTCVMAGGRDAVFHAHEALEDHGEIARSDLEKWGLKAEDTVVAASASGRTPYCVSALDYALSLGCGRVALVCNRDSEMARHADVAIEVDTGPEVIMGSTRMKAGTAQKMVMNMLSTAVMVRMGRTYDNLMIMIKARNTKANHRMLRLFSQAVGNPDLNHAREMLAAADGDLGLAVLMERTGFSLQEVQRALEAQHGHFDRALWSLEAHGTDSCKTG